MELNNEHITRIEDALKYARKKHPKFADTISLNSLETIRKMLNLEREINGEKIQIAINILDEEMLEAQEQWLMGNNEKCIKELYQCAAVIIRMVEFVEGK